VAKFPLFGELPENSRFAWIRGQCRFVPLP
jgi:hypothetical protein